MGNGNPWGPARRAAERNRRRMQQEYEAEFQDDSKDFAGSENYKTKKPKKNRDF